jgi:predicted nuclease of restriction endonuclease-like (RecB) superfamily
VNLSLTIRNWLIGFYIVEFELHGEDRAVYGQKLFDELALRLKKIKGIDRRSLYRFKDFYHQYPHIAQYIIDNNILSILLENKTLSIVGLASPQFNRNQIPVSKILLNLSYSHFELLLSIDDNLKRTFYEIACINGTWSVKELKRQINSLYFERSGMSIKPENLNLIINTQAEKISTNDIVKSMYIFEFLGLKAKDAVEENDLETALLDHLQEFMLEMGHGFCLEARQKKILIGEEYFFIDLVFYHCILKCHVLFDLKVENFNHLNIGQLNTYVNYYKAKVMLPDDNPTIGILLVTDKNNALVEYTTAGMDNQLFVSKYLLELPNKETLEDFIKNELQNWK